MKSFYKEAAPFFVSLALAPLLIGLISSYSLGLGIISFLIGLPMLAVTLLVGSAVWLTRGVNRMKEAGSRMEAFQYGAASPLMFVSVLLVAWPSLTFGQYVGNLSRLAVNYPHYERIIGKAQQQRTADGYVNDDGVEYSVDLGPPVRVAFNPAGMLDNWSAIIFDPTGEMLKADGFDPKTGKFHAPDRITKLFGGALVKCRRLWGDFLTCSFT